MLKFIYIKVGVDKMSKKHIFAKFYAVIFSLFVALPAMAGNLPNNIELSTKLDLFAAKASVPSTFLEKYDAATAKLGIDFAYHLNDNLNIVVLPYIHASYGTNRDDKTQTRVQLWQSYLDYKLSDFKFVLGRFDFANKNLSPFIYYGEDLIPDFALPSALDGVKNSFKSKYFDYTLIAAKEVQIDENKKAKIAGANIDIKPADWVSLSGFYFFQHKNYFEDDKDISENLSLYGGGLNLIFSETSGFSLYAAQNGGNKKSVRYSITQKIPYKGYALSGEFYTANTYKTGVLNSKFGFHTFSDKKKFTAMPNKLNTGIIYGGMNYKKVFPSSPKIIYGNFDFNFKKYPFLFAGADIFVYGSEKTDLNSRTYYAKELNINAAIKFDTWGFKLSGGLFEGEALFLGGTTTEKQKIKKLQANFFYKFTL